jgi:predicted nucleic acid-binding protein
VTRYLVDTNILSELSRPQPLAVIVDWLRTVPDTDLFIATMTIAEIWRGILQRASGRGRRDLETWFAGPAGPQALFAARILPFGEEAAIEWARIMAEATASGRPRNAIDMVIAATAVANDCVVATANEPDFQGAVDFFNPLRPAR